MINTERLSIRRVAASDWRAIQTVWAEVKKTEYAQYDRPTELSDAAVRQRIAKWGAFAESPEHIFFAVCLGHALIGYVAFHQRESGFELGYCFHPDFWGKGYAKESISALLKELRSQGRAACVSAGTALNNTPSVSLLLSLGFRQVGSEKVSFYKDRQGNELFFDGGIFELRL